MVASPILVVVTGSGDGGRVVFHLPSRPDEEEAVASSGR